MTNEQRVLGPKAYINYRNVRAVATLLAILGAIFLFGGTIMTITGPQPDKPDGLERWESALMAVLGLTGLVGGAATLGGNRKLSRLVRIMAVFYLLAIPIGTILGVVLLTGLAGFHDSLDRLREAREEDADERDNKPRSRRMDKD